MGMKRFPCWWIADGACACPKGEDCGSPGKHPITRNGVKDATDDPDQLEAWEEQYPDANWAIATGEPSDFEVVDLDIKPTKNGVQSLAELAKAHGGIPQTHTTRTGGGGLHLRFKHVDGVTNSTDKVGPGIDVRGTGGYIMAPGSSHISGGAYEVIDDRDPVDCPAWLLSLIVGRSAQVPTKRNAQIQITDSFPPASSEVLQQAREALERHGPAPERVDGEGGGQHTVQAAAILTHDFALTDEEAWPLLVEWNESNPTPWDTEGDDRESLRYRLANGRKYGKGEYGARRTADSKTSALALIDAWDGSATTLEPMIESIRRFKFRTAIERDTVERELINRTGVKAKLLNLPKWRDPVELKQGEVRVSTDLHETLDETVTLLAPQVFHRAGVLCEVVTGRRVFIAELEPARIREVMSRTATYVRTEEDGTLKKQTAPMDVAMMLHARRTFPTVREIESITSVPIFLADGTILQERGYNAQARVYLEPNVDVNVPDEPDHDDALEAVETFKDLLCDFYFHAPEDFSSWLAGLLSPLVKAATGNAPSPLILMSASSPGAGKTLLVDLISRIVTGGGVEVRTYNPKDPSEWGKRLTSFVKAGSPVSVFDNVNGLIGDDGLDKLITTATWSDRLLGASDAPPLPNVTTWFATGNNIEPTHDTARRVLLCRVDVKIERPQERGDFKRPELAEYVDAHRSELLTAALVILRAYHLAGRPDQALPSWGSFTTWSALVRGALVWAGLPDPHLTQQRASAESNEPENAAHDFWITVVGMSDGTAAAIAGLAEQRQAREVLGLRETISPGFLRKFVSRFVDKPRAGQCIRRIVTAGVSTYRVEAVG